MKEIRTEGNKFYDKNGKEFIPHGINMVCKDKSLGYIGNYCKEDFLWLKTQGFNLIRLGIFWDGVEPAPGLYNDSYLEKVDKIIDMAGLAGIPVFLDMHQDLYSADFEDGAPGWATITDGFTYEKTELWSDAYLMNQAVQHAFDNFWNNTPASDSTGLMDHFANMWKYVAQRYKENENVIGYDLFNEPFPGSSGAAVGMIMAEAFGDGSPEALENLTNPQVLMALISKIEPIAGDFEEKYLNPFYCKIAKAIREVDKETLIMIESNYFANAGIPSHLQVPTDSEGNQLTNIVYAPHGYDILVDTEGYSAGGNDRVDFIFGSLAQTTERLNIPTLIGEWGCYPNASEGQMSQAKHLIELFGQLHIGHTYFDFSHIYDGGIIKVLSRK